MQSITTAPLGCAHSTVSGWQTCDKGGAFTVLSSKTNWANEAEKKCRSVINMGAATKTGWCHRCGGEGWPLSSPPTAAIITAGNDLHLASQVIMFQCLFWQGFEVYVAGVDRFSESMAELLCVLSPSIAKLLIWEHRAKKKGGSLYFGKCCPFRIACMPATAAVKWHQYNQNPAPFWEDFSFLGRWKWWVQWMWLRTDCGKGCVCCMW